MKKSRYYTKGFTLIEIVIVIAIIVILGTAVLVSFNESRNVRDLTTSSQNALSILRLAQARTLAGENDSAWGIRLASNQITLFEGDTFAGSPFTNIYPLPNSMQITNISLNGGGIDVVFKRVTGETDQTGTFLLSVINSPSNSFSVTIDSLGKVYQTNTFPAATVTRTVDTRHRSFTLGWSIKTATTMTLTFDDPIVVQPVTMSPFFDAGKTKFDWTGTVSVGELPQVLRIHTTTLTDTNTVLSIDRDCRKNTKNLTIDIDGKVIATYEANCAAISVGAFGGTMSEP
ncbi:MAG: prepilin-type N-terminal cleavage/methylation domain-containing protein [Patescibacteria group bacterium]